MKLLKAGNYFRKKSFMLDVWQSFKYATECLYWKIGEGRSSYILKDSFNYCENSCVNIK